MATSIIVRWSPPQQTSQNGIIRRYKISYSLTAIYGINNTIVMLGNVTQYIIYNLSPSSNYSIQIAAATSVGFGPYNTPIVHLTHPAGNSYPNISLMIYHYSYLSWSKIKSI